MTDAFLDMAREALEEIFGGGYIATIKNYVLEGTGGTFQSAWDVVSTIYAAVAPIGLILLVVYFLIDLMEGVTMEQINIESLIKRFIKLVIAEIIISNGMTLITGFIDFGNGLANLVSVTFEDYMADTSIIDSIIDSADGLGGAIGLYIQTLIPRIACWVVSIAVKIVCFSRVLELAARCMFAPIAVADMFSGGTRSSGFRYLKKILALCVQGVVMLAIGIGVSAIESGIFTNASMSGWEFILTTLAINFTAVTMLFKSQGIANDVAGV